MARGTPFANLLVCAGYFPPSKMCFRTKQFYGFLTDFSRKQKDSSQRCRPTRFLGKKSLSQAENEYTDRDMAVVPCYVGNL